LVCALAWGARGREFKSHRPDHLIRLKNYMASVIASLFIFFNCLGFSAYLVTFFNWGLSPEQAVGGDELMNPVPLLIMIGCASAILVMILLRMAKVSLGTLTHSVRRLIQSLTLFGVVLYFATAGYFPRHPLRVDSANIQINDGKWEQIEPAKAESFFRQNIRRNIASLIFFGNVAINGFVYYLFAKSTSNESSSSDGIFGAKKRTE
jgi:hypothetical protein